MTCMNIPSSNIHQTSGKNRFIDLQLYNWLDSETGARQFENTVYRTLTMDLRILHNANLVHNLSRDDNYRQRVDVGHELIKYRGSERGIVPVNEQWYTFN